MRPNIDQLEALYWISKLGSFRGAARRLGLSQPAVSGRIRELERGLGFEVVDRAGARPRLTPRGVEVLRHAEQMISLAENFRVRFGARRELPSQIRMGAADSFALTHLSALLMRIAELHPGTQVDLQVDFSANLDRRLHTGELDVAFLTSPSPGPMLVSTPLVQLDLAWLASPRLGLGGRVLTPADLIGVPIVTNPRPSHLYATILAWFASAGFVPQRLNTCSSLTIMGKLTIDGVGASVLPTAVLRREIARGRLVRLRTEPELPRHLIMGAYRVDTGRGALAEVTEIARALVRGRS